MGVKAKTFYAQTGFNRYLNKYKTEDSTERYNYEINHQNKIQTIQIPEKQKYIHPHTF